MTSIEYELLDRVTRDEGSVFLTGVQALARLPVEQLRADRAAGLRTAAFASGYPGSPLAGLDMELARASAAQPDLPIVLRPALNEELGVSAVMGSQLAQSRPDAIYDGVVGLWYGKAPGLDRSSDALRHAVFAGTSTHGGAVAIVGDDPGAKSSTLPSSSDATFVDLHIPILYPGDVEQALDLGRHAIAMSRASGLWVGLKVVGSVADGSSTVELDPHRVTPVMPTVDGRRYECKPDGLLLGAHSLEIEQELRGVRTELAIRYGALNGLNRLTVDSPEAWLGIMASGVTHRELMEAMRRLGLDKETLARSGVRVLEMQMPIPFSPEVVRDFARGLEEVMVVEEMNPTLAQLVRDCLYDTRDHPYVTGKRDRHGEPQFPSHGPLVADRMVEPLRAALSARLGDAMATPSKDRERIRIPVNDARTPFFCSGCPHNQSTRTPEGTIVGAGIGCHTMALLSDDPRLGDIVTISAMGSEGAPWIGMSSFVETPHLTQNLGDGTYFHSGQLAIQAAVDSGVDMTYKILLNGHVAMTGGQLPPGQIDAGALSGVLLTQGVSRVIITTDDEDRLRHLDIPANVEVWDRHRIIEAQELLAQVPGITVLIHDQPCAAELRRARRRGSADTPTRRAMINERVCEGCGDCSEKSSCLSVQPTDTPFGRKTRIDQSSCNLDLACLDGDCPSFMSVRTRPKRWWHRQRQVPGSPSAPPLTSGSMPTGLDSPPEHIHGETRIRFAGIGGTGVVTVSQIVGTAAMLDGLDVRGLDQTGLSQKAGPVLSDLYLTAHGSEYATNHLGDGQADLLVAFDPIVAAAESTLAAADPARTTLIGSTSATPTASMITDPSGKRDDPLVIRSRVDAACGPDPRWIDAVGAADRLVGERAAANILLTGVAVQSGALPISLGSMLAAIDLNGVAVSTNTAAFEWGRCAVADPEQFEAALARCETEPGAPSTPLPPSIERGIEELGALDAPEDLVAEVGLRCTDLIAFQDSALAADYLATVLRFARAEGAMGQSSWQLTESVATQLHRVLAYKDEYEVARLLLDPTILEQARDLADNRAKVSWNLHPPMLRSLGLERKIEIGIGAAPLMRLLARGKGLRGHRFDPFGMAGVRRAERRLIGTYRNALEQLLDTVCSDNYHAAVRIASLPETIRGYEDRKLARIAEFDRMLPNLLAELGGPPPR